MFVNILCQSIAYLFTFYVSFVTFFVFILMYVNLSILFKVITLKISVCYLLKIYLLLQGFNYAILSSKIFCFLFHIYVFNQH